MSRDLGDRAVAPGDYEQAIPPLSSGLRGVPDALGGDPHDTKSE